MTMKITMMVESDDLNEVARIAAALAGVNHAPAEPLQEFDVAAELVPIAEEDATPIPEPSHEDMVEALQMGVLEKARADMKETRSATLGDGSKAAKGDEVMTPDTGEVGVVLATFRGKMVVADEAGTEILVQATDLVPVSQEDAAPAVEPEPAAEVETAPASEDMSIDDLRAKIQETMQKCESTQIRDVLLAHGAVNVTSVPADKRAAVYADLEALSA